MFLGIELGSTRIKAVIIGGDGAVIASGAFAWENKPLPGNVWTYDLADARAGLAAAYAACADGYAAKHGARPTRFDRPGPEPRFRRRSAPICPTAGRSRSFTSRFSTESLTWRTSRARRRLRATSTIC